MRGGGASGSSRPRYAPPRRALALRCFLGPGGARWLVCPRRRRHPETRWSVTLLPPLACAGCLPLPPPVPPPVAPPRARARGQARAAWCTRAAKAAWCALQQGVWAPSCRATDGCAAARYYRGICKGRPSPPAHRVAVPGEHLWVTSERSAAVAESRKSQCWFQDAAARASVEVRLQMRAPGMARVWRECVKSRVPSKTSTINTIDLFAAHLRPYCHQG